jgi:hypothetical protein
MRRSDRRRSHPLQCGGHYLVGHLQKDLVGPPLDWARTQMNLGNALRVLGSREAGTARLEQAVEAFDASLTVITSVWPERWV